MKQYLDLGKIILGQGRLSGNRTATSATAIFGHQMRFNLAHGFPLTTTKKTIFKPMIAELLWFLEGSGDNNRLHELGARFWDQWALEDGRTGAPYGRAWRSWPTQSKGVIDQIGELMIGLKNKPLSRRHIVTAWNPEFLPDETKSPQANIELGNDCLAACHCLFQFHVEELTLEEREAQAGLKTDLFDDTDIFSGMSAGESEDRLNQLGIPRYRLSCQLYQRSADFPIGVPVNIASYSLLLTMVAQCVNMVPHEFVWTGGNIHVYQDQIELFQEQLQREPYPMPQVKINPDKTDIFSFEMSDFELVNYQHHPAIKYPVAT